MSVCWLNLFVCVFGLSPHFLSFSIFVGRMRVEKNVFAIILYESSSPNKNKIKMFWKIKKRKAESSG